MSPSCALHKPALPDRDIPAEMKRQFLIASVIKHLRVPSAPRSLKVLMSPPGTHTLCPWGQDTRLSSALGLSPRLSSVVGVLLSSPASWVDLEGLLPVASLQPCLLLLRPGPLEGPRTAPSPRPSPPACCWGLLPAAGSGLEKGSAGRGADDCLLLHPRLPGLPPSVPDLADSPLPAGFRTEQRVPCSGPMPSGSSGVVGTFPLPHTGCGTVWCPCRARGRGPTAQGVGGLAPSLHGEQPRGEPGPALAKLTPTLSFCWGGFQPVRSAAAEAPERLVWGWERREEEEEEASLLLAAATV